MKPLPCRFISTWLCTLYKEENNKNIVNDTVCDLCIKARAINQDNNLPLKLTTALNTLNTYTGRLERTLARLEKKEGTT